VNLPAHLDATELPSSYPETTASAVWPVAARIHKIFTECGSLVMCIELNTEALFLLMFT
jgi:hypothetical protein